MAHPNYQEKWIFRAEIRKLFYGTCHMAWYTAFIYHHKHPIKQLIMTMKMDIFSLIKKKKILIHIYAGKH